MAKVPWSARWIVGQFTFFIGSAAFAFGTPINFFAAVVPHYNPICVSFQGMDHGAGVNYLVGVACVSLGALLAAAGAAIQGKPGVAAVMIGLGAVVFAALSMTGVITTSRVQEAVRVVEHPPAPQPGIQSDAEICQDAGDPRGMHQTRPSNHPAPEPRQRPRHLRRDLGIIVIREQAQPHRQIRHHMRR